MPSFDAIMSKRQYTKPPYTITPLALRLSVSISEKLGEIKTAYLQRPPAELRKRNRINTIHSSLKIEGNTLTVEQITALLEGKRVLAPQKDIVEVKNAIEVYDQLDRFKPYDISSMLAAHKILMNGLVERAGRLRGASVGILKGSEIAHIAPPADIVRPLLGDLLEYVKSDPDILLVKSCVFHYEFEFIHPFTDGNGRMGRLWQTVLLRQYNPVFEFLPVETLIKKRQQEYYDVLERSDKGGNSTLFLEFMLSIINDSLEELLGSQNVNLTAADRVGLFRCEVGDRRFSRSDYIRHFKTISSATATRDLRQATGNGVLEKFGDGRLTEYQYMN
jgi:Fic family protein